MSNMDEFFEAFGRFWEFLTLGRLGLMLNIVGTLMIAFSFGRNLEDAHQIDNQGREIYLASFLYPGLFRIGIAMIVLGFLFQLMA